MADNLETGIPIDTPDGFDFSQILLMINQDYGQLLSILNMFRFDFANTEQKINAHLVKNELAQAERILHQMKGVAGNIGAIELYQISQTLDEQLKQQDYDTELLRQWQAVFADTLHSIDRFTAQFTVNQTPDLKSHKHKSTILAAQLQDLLHQRAFISLALLNQFQISLAAEQLDHYQMLLNQINRFDYPAASNTLAIIMSLAVEND